MFLNNWTKIITKNILRKIIIIKMIKTKIKRKRLLWICFRVNSFCVLLCCAIFVYMSDRVIYGTIGKTESYKVWSSQIKDSTSLCSSHMKKLSRLTKWQVMKISCLLLFTFIIHMCIEWWAIGLGMRKSNHMRLWVKHWGKTVIIVILDVNSISHFLSNRIKG